MSNDTRTPIDAGARIHEYPSRRLHAKTGSIDGGRAVQDTPSVGEHRFFLNDERILSTCEPARRARLERWAERRWSVRALEGVGWARRRGL